MPRREPDFHEKRRFDDGATLEVTIYAVRSPVPGSKHRLKYSLFYGKNGKRLVGYDNEKPKGIIATTEALRRPISFRQSSD
jgi:Family of unknown function (DUF6516)